MSSGALGARTQLETPFSTTVVKSEDLAERQVSKLPTDQAVRSIDIGYKSSSIWSEHVDLGGHFGADDRFGYRLNATHEEGKTFNDGGIRRDSVSLARS